jgi:adenylate kinase
MGNGQLADSDLVINVMHAEFLKLVHAPTPVTAVLIDGFPRKIDELTQWIQLTSLPSAVVYCNCDEEVIVKKLINRRMCSSCGKNYNSYKDEFLGPIVPTHDGRCDECGSELIQRSDDREEAIWNRLTVYSENEERIRQYFLKNVEIHRIVEIDSTSGREGLGKAVSSMSFFNNN